MEFEQQSSVNLVPCRFCGRTFAEISIARHTKVCEKSSRKRAVFNSSKQRAVEVIDPNFKPKVKNARVKSAIQPSKQSNWRQKHEDFIRTVRAAREVTVAMKEGRKLPPPPPPTINPDYIQCPHCMRRFNQTAAERHITFCAEQQKRLGIKKSSPGNQSATSSTRASARQQYRPPLPQSSAVRRKNNEFAPKSAQPLSIRGGRLNQPRPSADSRRVGTSTYNHSSVSAFKGKSNSLPERIAARKPTRAVHPEWDASLESSAMDSEVRTKTGLKPAKLSNSNTENFSQQAKSAYGDIRYQPSVKPTVRKVASKNSLGDFPNRHLEKKSPIHQRPRHDWSSDSDSDGGVQSYKASAYEDSSQSRYKVVNGARKSSASSDASKRSDGVGKSHSVRTRNVIKGYNNGLNQGISSIVHDDGEAYDWMQPRQSRSHYSSSATNCGNELNLQSSKFCHECGARYPVANAKFCCECGIKRITL